jgi:hypothetical protein
MLNSELTLDLARRWAERLVAEHGDSPQDIIQTAYRAAFGREATKKEIELSQQFLTEELQSRKKPGKLGVDEVAAFCHALFNTNEFITVD